MSCDFTDNHCALVGNEVKGGAIDTFLQTKVVYITNSTFAGNSCQSGGAIGSIGTSHTIINSAFTKNQAETGNGGAIANDGDTYTLSLCGTTLSDNAASDYGGAVFYVSNDGSGTTTIDNSSVTGNSSTEKKHSGGLYLQGTQAVVRNSTIAKTALISRRACSSSRTREARSSWSTSRSAETWDGARRSTTPSPGRS